MNITEIYKSLAAQTEAQTANIREVKLIDFYNCTIGKKTSISINGAVRITKYYDKSESLFACLHKISQTREAIERLTSFYLENWEEQPNGIKDISLKFTGDEDFKELKQLQEEYSKKGWVMEYSLARDVTELYPTPYFMGNNSNFSNVNTSLYFDALLKAYKAAKLEEIATSLHVSIIESLANETIYKLE